MTLAHIDVVEFSVEGEDNVYLLTIDPPTELQAVKNRLTQPDFMTFSLECGFDLGVCEMGEKSFCQALGGVALIINWDISPTPYS